MQLEEGATVIQLKERIASQSAVPFARQKLICAGKVVGGTSQLDAKTLEQAGLKENALIMVHQTAADEVLAVQLAQERVAESVDQVEKTAAALASRQSGGSRSREQCVVVAPSTASLMRFLCGVRITTCDERHAICWQCNSSTSLRAALGGMRGCLFAHESSLADIS